MERSQQNPRISLLLHSVTAIEVLVLLASGGGLLVLPSVLPEIWPWSLAPFNTAFLGAIYLSSMIPAALLVLIGRWSPARIVVPMILLFTTIILLISLVYLDRFNGHSPFTWLWFVLYSGIPINAAYHFWLYRTLPPASQHQLGTRWRRILLFQSIVFGLYGVGLLIVPSQMSAFWPWPVDAFHARLYSVVFLTPALGAFLLRRAAAWDEVLTIGLTQVAALLPILGLLIADAARHSVNWADAGTWLWVGSFVVLVVVGIGLLREARRIPRLTPRINEAGLVIPSRYLALLFGIAFILAGLGGFVPLVTLPPPDGAPGLHLPHSYVYLIGLFPVNIVHSLFHLGVGILGLLAYRRTETARIFLRGSAIVLAVLTVMGLVPLLNTTFGVAPLFGHDVWLHGVEAAAAGYVGFVMPREPEPSVETPARTAISAP